MGPKALWIRKRKKKKELYKVIGDGLAALDTIHDWRELPRNVKPQVKFVVEGTPGNHREL